MYDGVLVSGQGTVFLYCIGQGRRQFIFHYVVYGHICLRCILCRTYLYTYRVLITYGKNGRGSMRYIYIIYFMISSVARRKCFIVITAAGY